MTTQLALPAGAGVAAVRYASWGRRLVAALLDSAVLAAVTWYVAGGAPVPPSLQPTFGEVPDDASSWTGSPGLVVAWLLLLVVQGLTGQTPGRRVVGIAVVRAPADGPVGGAPGVLRSVGRWFAHLLDAILLVGYLRPLWHPERRTFADSLVGTAVVERAPGRDGAARVATVVAWALVVVGVAAGVPVGRSGGTEPLASTPCVLEPEVRDVPGTVRVTVDEELEWWHDLRLLTWPRTPQRSEATHRTLQVEWQGVDGAVPDGAGLVVRVATSTGTTDNELTGTDGRATVTVEQKDPGPLSVTVLWRDRALGSCRVEPAAS